MQRDRLFADTLTAIRSNVSESTFADLQQFLMKQPNDDTWALNRQSSYLFAFTIVTSIGYGSQFPTTQGGQIFFCAYALVSIPIAGVSFGRVASGVVDLLTWARACRRSRIRASFATACGDAAVLDHNSAREAITEAQRCSVDPVEYEALLRMVDPRNSNTITYSQFAWLYVQLGSLDQRVTEKSRRANICGFSFVAWIVVGAPASHAMQQAPRPVG